MKDGGEESTLLRGLNERESKERAEAREGCRVEVSYFVTFVRQILVKRSQPQERLG